MPTTYRNVLILLCCLSPSLHATSRASDGEAKVWLEGQTLCFGADDYKSPGLFFNRTRLIDENDVHLYALQVFRSGVGEYWGLGPAQNSAGNTLALKSDTCIAYGAQLAQLPANPAKELDDGLYEVILYANEQRRSERVTLTKQFCIRHDAEAIQLRDAHYEQSAGKWQCH